MTSLIGDHGLIAVFALMTLAAVLPAASELTMIYAGALASGALAGRVALGAHRFAPGLDAYLAVCLAAVAGNVLGAGGGWLLGSYGGQPLLERFGRYLHVTPARVERAERWFERYEEVAVPLGFATPIVRSFVAFPAGMIGVPARRFLVSTLPGIAAFAFAVAGIGWAVGSGWHAARHDADVVDAAVVVCVLAVGAAVAVRSRRSVKMARGASDSAR